MSPWNYPYLLSLDPLFGAIAAGNCVVLKPSAYAPNTSRAMAELIAAVFPPDWVTVIQGGREQNAALLEQKFDYIFFTGSVDVGKMVMEKASRHLTPVTLELGGKSPVIVDRTANLPLTARRLAFGKILNAGQTCVAPDYCLVDRTVRDRLVEELKKQFQKMLGEDPLANRDFVRIINRKHYNRLQGLLEGENLLYGGGHRDDPDSDSGWIAPTLVADTLEGTSKPMGEEIFGPILPIIPYDTLDQCYEALDNYFASMLQMAASPYYDVVGHVIYPLRYMNGPYDTPDLGRYRDQIREILRLAIDSGRGMEINTWKGQTLAQWIPLLQDYKELGGEILTVGSDAHAPGPLGKGIQEAYTMMADCGFRYVAVYHERKPEMIRLK